MQKPPSNNHQQVLAKPSAARDLLRNTIFRRLSSKNSSKEHDLQLAILLETKKKVTAFGARTNGLMNQSQFVERRSQKENYAPLITCRERIQTKRKATGKILESSFTVMRKESIHTNNQDLPEVRETNCSFEGQKARMTSISNRSFLSKPTTSQKTARIVPEPKQRDSKVCRKLVFESKEIERLSCTLPKGLKTVTRHSIVLVQEKTQFRQIATKQSTADKSIASNDQDALAAKAAGMSPRAKLSSSPISAHFTRILNRMDAFLLTGPFSSITDKPLKFDLAKSKRVCLYNKMAKLVLHFPVLERTWFLAVELFEQLSALVDIPPAKLEITSLACFAIAAKTETVRSPSLRSLLERSQLRDSLSNLVMLEDYVLKVFDYRLIQVLTYDYYCTFSMFAGFAAKEHKMGLLILKLHTSESNEYIRDKQLVAFSVCYLLSKRFKLQSFWVRFPQNGRDFLGLKIQSSNSAICDYAFDKSVVERTCKEVADACSNCSSRDYDSIIQLFSSTRSSRAN